MKFHLPIVLLALCTLPLTSVAQTEAMWLRYPAISPDGSSIVFSYQGDLWKVDAAGGTATLLTTSEAYEHSPVWSHNGSSIAFASDRHGNNDVFVMPSNGGVSTRLTVHSASDIPSDFTPNDSDVIFSSSRLDSPRNRQFAFGVFPELYAVSVSSANTRQVITTPVLSAHFNKDGKMLVFHDRKGYEDEFRKHHTSSVTRDIWTYDLGSKKYNQISSFAGEDRDPLFSADGQEVYYLSEEHGTFNVYKMPVAGGASTQITFLEKDPVRYLSSSDEGLLCFAYQGALYTMQPGAQPQRITVNVAMDRRFVAEKTVPVKGGATEMHPSPNGKEVVFVHRGEVFVTSAKEGTTRRITNTPEQERSASFSPDGRSIVYASERNGSWDLYTTRLTRKEESEFFNATVLKEEVLLATPAEEFQPVWSPDGKQVAYLEERTAIKVIDLTSKKTRTIMPKERNYSYSDGDQYFSWSPDSKWLLVEFLQDDQWIQQCGLVSAEGGKPLVNLTKSGYGGYHPKWSTDGTFMIWFSGRDGMKNHASWGGQQDVYAMFFTQAAFDTFNLNKEEYELLSEEDKKKEGEDTKQEGKNDKDKKEKKEKEVMPSPLTFELDHIEDRKARLTINSSDLSDAVLSKDGQKLFYLCAFESGFDLWQTDLRSKETKILAKMGADDAGSLVLSKDGKTLFLQNSGGISAVDIESGEVKGVGINGEMTLNEGAERAYLFEHVWRQVKEKFYRVDLQGTDWDYYKKEYAGYLPYINNSTDFADLLSEMLGELNASHTGARYRSSSPSGDATASLGLFYDDDDGQGLEIVEVMDRSPVVKSTSKIRSGVRIEKVDGQTVNGMSDLSAQLNRKAGKNTLISLYDPRTASRWDETVKPIDRGEENELLYHRWVEQCRHTVDSLSGGKIGYVHVRGMNNESFQTVYEDVLGKYHDKAALVVDTRFNGGGWLHDDLATFLSGHTYMRLEPRGQPLGTEPQFKWNKPSVVVMSECNYSDAHMFPVTYKALDIGKLVGMPVPGTGTAVWWETMQNGVVFGIPQVGMIDMNGHFLENQQLEPDVKQANAPGLLSTGTDQQLGAAVKTLLEELK